MKSPFVKYDIVGQRFGRLVVVADSGMKDNSGSVKWLCQCDCGNTHLAVASNLKSGGVSSCRCLQRELSSQRRKATALPRKKCSVEGCNDTTHKGAHGLCGMHYMRNKRYGDVNYITPPAIAQQHLSDAQPTKGICKDTTYQKDLGRHKHRRVMEESLGRPLTPDELVHHIDENRHNNDILNLQLVDHSSHAKIHFTKRKEELTNVNTTPLSDGCSRST